MNAIEVKNLSKKYDINHQVTNKPKTLKELLIWKKKDNSCILNAQDDTKKTEIFWALKDISFNIAEGERIAIIGGNGAGKSTLLKILSRITEPTTGQVTIKGKVSSLLEVGTGFHPELTGRENIYLNGAILGMSRREITSKFDRIVDFSGVEKFIDTPVKHYSSGMYVRLAFSVSAWLDPDILIVDEVLSVGDQAFQKKCSDRMKDLAAEGRTVLFVSHSMQAVKAMCSRAIFLEQGKITAVDSVEEVINQYARSIEIAEVQSWIVAEKRFNEMTVSPYVHSTEYMSCKWAGVLDNNNQCNGLIEISSKFKVVIRLNVKKKLPLDAVPSLHFYDEFGNRFFVTYPEFLPKLNVGENEIHCNLEPFLFNVGKYYVTIIMSSPEWGGDYPNHFVHESALRFEVVEKNFSDMRRHGWKGLIPGMSRPRLEWTFTTD